jgi:hypothetical protein
MILSARTLVQEMNTVSTKSGRPNSKTTSLIESGVMRPTFSSSGSFYLLCQQGSAIVYFLYGDRSVQITARSNLLTSLKGSLLPSP